MKQYTYFPFPLIISFFLTFINEFTKIFDKNNNSKKMFQENVLMFPGDYEVYYYADFYYEDSY